MMYDREYFLGQSWSTVLAKYPPTSCQSTAVGAEPEREKATTLCRHCSAKLKPLPCYQQYFSHKPKAPLHMGCCEENSLFPIQIHYSKMVSALSAFPRRKHALIFSMALHWNLPSMSISCSQSPELCPRDVASSLLIKEEGSS